MNAPELTAVPDKGMSTYAMEPFTFFIFNTFCKVVKNHIFCFALPLCLECRLMWKKVISSSLTEGSNIKREQKEV